MHVQGMHQGRAFLYDPHPRMLVTMNAAFVGLGLAKPTFQIQVVARACSVVNSYEQPRLKAGHDLAHVPSSVVVAGKQLVSQGFKFLMAPRARPARRFQRFLDRLDCRDVSLDRLQFVRDLAQTTVDAFRQTSQLALSAPPFFAWRFRSRDCRTSANASDIRRPGGCSGPPWSSLRIPFTAVQ